VFPLVGAMIGINRPPDRRAANSGLHSVL